MNDEMKEYFRIIMITILAAIIIGIIISLIYNGIKAKNPEEDHVENFVGDNMSTGLESLGKKENNQIDMNFELGSECFSLNNDNPLKDIDGYQEHKVKLSGTGHSIRFYFPKSWKNNYATISTNGVDMYYDTMDMQDIENVSYEEFLEKFVEKIKNQNFYTKEMREKLKFTSRKIQINDRQYTVLMNEGNGRAVESYFCLAKDGYAFYLKIDVNKDEYDAKMIKTIDTIFSSFVVL